MLTEKFCFGSFHWRKSSGTCSRCCSWSICRHRRKIESVSQTSHLLKEKRWQFAPKMLSVPREDAPESWTRTNRWEEPWRKQSDSKYFCRVRCPVFWWSVSSVAVRSYFQEIELKKDLKSTKSQTIPLKINKTIPVLANLILDVAFQTKLALKHLKAN